MTDSREPKLLSGGNPQIPKGEGKGRENVTGDSSSPHTERTCRNGCVGVIA